MMSMMDTLYIPMFSGGRPALPSPSSLIVLEDSDSEYEEPQQRVPNMPPPNPDPLRRKADIPRERCPLPELSPQQQQQQQPPPPFSLGNRKLPPEPIEDDQENYEDPSSPMEPDEDYEQPDNCVPVTSRPPALQKKQHSPPPPPKIPQHRRASPPSLPSTTSLPPPSSTTTLPPPIPTRVKPQAVKIIKPKTIPGPDEDYVQPDPPLSLKQTDVVDRCEIVNSSGRLKPSNIKKSNYSKVDVGKPVGSWLDTGAPGVPVKPSEIREKNAASMLQNNNNNILNETDVRSARLMKPQERLTPQAKSPGVRAKSPGVRAQSPGLQTAPEQQDVESLYGYTWYHDNLTRDRANKRLLSRTQNGMFLVRKSSQNGSPYALSLFYGGRVYNLNIRLRSDKKYALGTQKPDEKAFSALPLLISYFQNNTLVLGGDTSTQTNLVQALPK